jgi:lysophospholipase L1-like esterase
MAWALPGLCNEQESAAKSLIVVIGDSITIGEMDGGVSKVIHAPDKPLTLGYVPRAQRQLPELDFLGIGYEGKSSLRILELLTEELKRSPALAARIASAQVVLFTGGFNDFWDNISPRATAYRLRTVAVVLGKLAPKAAVYVATIISPRDVPQSKWVFQTNRVVLSRSLKHLEVGPRFETLPVELLSRDGIHPSSEGYDFMADKLVEFLCQPTQGMKTHTCSSTASNIDLSKRQN